MSRVTLDHFRSQNTAPAGGGGFTFETGVLTASAAYDVYGITVPSDCMVSADGATWYRLLKNDKVAQLGFTDIAYNRQPDGNGWNDMLDDPQQEYNIRQNMRTGDNVDITMTLAELQLNSASMFLNSPIGNGVVSMLLMMDGESIHKQDLYDMPIVELTVR